MKSRAVALAIKNHSHFLQEKLDLQGASSLLVANTNMGGVCAIFFPVFLLFGSSIAQEYERVSQQLRRKEQVHFVMFWSASFVEMGKG